MAKRTKPKTATASNSVLVHFEFVQPTAQRVCIAGTFNDWHCSATPMIAMGEGRWAKELLLPPGTYEYRFVADSEWVTDDEGKETVANPFGSHNTILRVPPPAEGGAARTRTKILSGTFSHVPGQMLAIKPEGFTSHEKHP